MTIWQGQATEFGHVNSLESIMHRNVTKRGFRRGVNAFSSEFSILSAIAVVKPLKTLSRSESKESRKVFERLLKTSVVLMHLAGNKSAAHEAHARPRAVAWR